jgi:hypothetical protein
MAGRKIKVGLDYWPMDVNFFSDIKIRKLIKYQSGKAITVYAYLLCTIYENGYYVRWDDELPFIVSEATGYDEAYILEVLKCCMNIGLFAKTLFDKEGVLTSKGIQERYSLICTMLKRTSVVSEFSVIDSEEIGINSEEIEESPEEMPDDSESMQQRKGKEIKRKKKKGETDSAASVFVPPTVEMVKQYFDEKGYSESSAITAWEFYAVADWIDSKGNPVKNWKQKMISVWFKQENLKSGTSGDTGTGSGKREMVY